MARKKIPTVIEDTFETLIPTYYEKNKEATNLKKQSDELNKKIKKLFTETDSTLVESTKAKKGERQYVVGDLKATYYLQERPSIDEEGLVEFLKKHHYTDAVKTVEVVDEEVLEKMMYEGTITKKHIGEMAKFKKMSDVAYLTVKVIKEAENE